MNARHDGAVGDARKRQQETPEVAADEREAWARALCGAAGKVNWTTYIPAAYWHQADTLLASPALATLIAKRQAEAWDEGVHAAFLGAVTRQNADDVKRGNPYRADLIEGEARP